jgi:hypothetical protein
MVLILFIAGVFHGCAAKSPTTGQEPGALVSVSKIEPRETDGKIEIVVEGTGPILQYTSFQLTEPLRLVVDMTDADVRKFPEIYPQGRGPY